MRLVDADALYKEISIWIENMNKSNSYVDAVERFAYSEVLDAIKVAPTIDPESLWPVGHWEEEDCDDVCSECGWEWGLDHYPTNYCPNCGAKMR